MSPLFIYFIKDLNVFSSGKDKEGLGLEKDEDFVENMV